VAEPIDGNRPRNRTAVDIWSLTHIVWAAMLTLVVGPVYAFVLMALWEPLEIYGLSPLMAKWGIEFGHEGWQNTVSDIGFNLLGVLVGYYGVVPWWNPFGLAA
jgi:hypothetical protein